MPPETFTTFLPTDPLIARYVDYYYLESKPENEVTTFECFPHYNNTISLYAAHRAPGVGQIVYDLTALPLQIFTPVRDGVLRVRQSGPVHRVVIVFRILGVQHFWRGPCFAEYQFGYSFFNREELRQLFIDGDTERLTTLLDGLLKNRFAPRPPDMVSNIIDYLFEHLADFSVMEMAAHFGTSRRHLHRVFKTAIGISIKRFHAIVVLRGVIDRKLSGKVDDNFTQLAYGANFSDQAHMIRAFHKLTRHAPRQFFAKGNLIGGADTFWHRLR